MQILKRLLYVVLIVPIFFVYGLVSAQEKTLTTPIAPIQAKGITTTDPSKSMQQKLDNAAAKIGGFENDAQKKKYDSCLKTRTKQGEQAPASVMEACTCIAKGGILLSSDVPGTTNGSVIKGRCVYTNGDTVSVANQIFQMITRIVMIILGITIFGMIVWGGMQFVIDPAGKGPENGKKMIMNAVIAGFAVSMIGVVLRFINPNIFK